MTTALRSYIGRYRDDDDLQNIIDWVQDSWVCHNYSVVQFAALKSHNLVKMAVRFADFVASLSTFDHNLVLSAQYYIIRLKVSISIREE